MKLNTERVQAAIAVLKRVVARNDNFDMSNWQQMSSDDEYGNEEEFSALSDEAELHRCGMAACFGGWLAASPEWKKDGGTMDASGGPYFDDGNELLFGSDAIAAWLGIENWTAANLTCSAISQYGKSDFYGKPVYAVTARDVIGKLEALTA